MKEEVTHAVETWLLALALPPAPADGAKDLKGQHVRVAKFTDDATLRYFFPRRTIPFQQHMVKDITRALKKRGAKIDSVRISIEDYACWLALTGESDTPEVRYRFASAPPQF